MSTQFHPAVQHWFDRQFKSVTDPQRLGWPAIQSGENVLIAAPTGSGKTLAAFLAALDDLVRRGLDGRLRDETQVLYVSPLKALSNDIHRNLDEPLEGIRRCLGELDFADVELRADLRTGDTPASKRQAMLRKPPHILVTTPESLYLLLTSDSGRVLLKTIRSVIVDEIHAVAGSRRGSHLALSLERLAALVDGPLQRIGLSATQRPIEDVASFLVGAGPINGGARCRIVDVGHRRDLDLAIELPPSPLEAVMSNEVWDEVYSRLAECIREHETTIVFVNTRRLAERVTMHLAETLGDDAVTAHHGSLSRERRFEAERRLKAGELRALVATASLELGIDIGSVDLVCQLGVTRSIAALLQRVGRSGHTLGATPKGRIFPLTRDELVEAVALLRSVEAGELDRLQIPGKPLDVLAQQLVAEVACQEYREDDLFELFRRAYPYRDLTRREFEDVLKMLAEGFSTQRGRRGALVHHDVVNRRIRGRRGARMTALINGGTIPPSADYRVVEEPAGIFVGNLNEDFAIESISGDVFQLGNASWRILQVVSGTVRVEDAKGQPPNIPFWFGESPARTDELSASVDRLRADFEAHAAGGALKDFEASLQGLVSPEVSETLLQYFSAGREALGCVPTQRRIVAERFFDETGGMQLVIHAPLGRRIHRAWGLALRKRFCRSFNFELQAAATEDGIVISLSEKHSFPLEDVFRFLNSKTVADLLVQALLDAPMFKIRWRWNASRSLAVVRQRGSRKVPPPIQRMEAEDLVAAVFPDQLACLENIAGDREIPEHPLVQQTIQDCLTEAMDIDGLIGVLEGIESGTIECVARDTTEPSPFCHELLNAKPYAFLDDAPLEERRTQAVFMRRVLNVDSGSELCDLDPRAIERVQKDAWPHPENADEAYDALTLLGGLDAATARRDRADFSWLSLLEELERQGRAGRLEIPTVFDGAAGPIWIPVERLAPWRALHPGARCVPDLRLPSAVSDAVSDAVSNAVSLGSDGAADRLEALVELVRGRLDTSGPVFADAIAKAFRVPLSDAVAALHSLEAEGFALRGRFRGGDHRDDRDNRDDDVPPPRRDEWCSRRLLARIHRLTIDRLRGEIEPVSAVEFMRFLFVWQRVAPLEQVEGPGGVAALVELLDGFELPAAAWEAEVLAARTESYDPLWLDGLCLSGQLGWGRLSAPGSLGSHGFVSGPLRSSPMGLFRRENAEIWLADRATGSLNALSKAAQDVFDIVRRRGALFFAEIQKESGLLATALEVALGELVAFGFVTSDSYAGLRFLLTPSERRPPTQRASEQCLSERARTTSGRRRRRVPHGIETAGRWSLLRGEPETMEADHREEVRERQARAFLRRYGVVFRKVLERESAGAPWREVARVLRRLEARGEIRGGRFVSGFSGEQFALPEAVGLLRSTRKKPPTGELIGLSAADPLNLLGIVTPGARVPAILANRILFQDGMPIAILEGGKIRSVAEPEGKNERELELALLRRRLSPEMRLYYG